MRTCPHDTLRHLAPRASRVGQVYTVTLSSIRAVAFVVLYRPVCAFLRLTPERMRRNVHPGLMALYVCIYVCMHACMHVCMHACMDVCMHLCMRVCMHACKSCMHACMYVCMHVCMFTYIQTYIHRYIHRYIDT